MIGIRVVGEVSCDAATVERDPWIPLKVSWWPRGQVQPLYMRVTGRSGGEIEMKADPATGALLEVIVIEEPRDSGPRDEFVAGPGHPSSNATPLLERSLWGLREGDDVGLGHAPAFLDVPDLAMRRWGDTAVIYFSAAPVAREVRCDAVTVGVAAGDTLVSIGVRLSG